MFGGLIIPSAFSSCSRLADLIKSSITCLASIRDSFVSSIFLRLSSKPAAPAASIFGRSIDPVSLNPDPLLGFLLNHHEGKWREREREKYTKKKEEVGKEEEEDEGKVG